MANNRKYIASWIKKKTFDNGGSVMNVRVKVSDLLNIENKDGWAKVVIGSRREESETGATHFMYEDEYEASSKAPPKPSSPENIHGDEDEDDTPF